MLAFSDQARALHLRPKENRIHFGRRKLGTRMNPKIFA